MFIIMMTLAECVRSHAEIRLITNDWPRKKGDLGIINEQSVRADSTLTLSSETIVLPMVKKDMVASKNRFYENFYLFSQIMVVFY